MQIEIISDIICPWCFIGKRRFERALAMRPQENLHVVWQPYQLNPTMPLGGMERKSYLAAKFGDLGRAERQNERLRNVGREEGIVFDFAAIKRTPNSINSHRLVQFARRKGRQEPIVEALFRGFFFGGLDLGDLDVLVQLGRANGLDEKGLTRYLYSSDDRAQVQALDENARQAGVTGVPCYVIDGKFAVSGAQSPEIFHQIFELARQESKALTTQSAAE
ncbi:DsbA family oxidoreductase [Alphaproteobacteria bacterium]|nr:DsbA family oxidoreductase [Alphaproteobacteria bacterium]